MLWKKSEDDEAKSMFGAKVRGEAAPNSDERYADLHSSGWSLKRAYV